MKNQFRVKNLCIVACLSLGLRQAQAERNHTEVMPNMKGGINACLPLAACYSQILREHGISSKVLQIRVAYKSALSGHSMVVFEFPVGSKKLWTYDFRGSFPVNASINDPINLANKAFEARGQHMNVLAADFIQSAPLSEPVRASRENVAESASIPPIVTSAPQIHHIPFHATVAITETSSFHNRVAIR